MVPTMEYRTRTAARRRQHTRNRLLQAILSLYAANRSDNAPTAEDVMAAANVSRGTFYKYFTSVHDIENVLGQELADQTTRELRAIASVGSQSPATRAALGALTLMARAVIEPSWGRFVIRADHLFPNSAMISAMRDTLLDGRKQGDFTFLSKTVATTFSIGVTMEGVRELISGHPHPVAFMSEMTSLMLRGLGTNQSHAEQTVQTAFRLLLQIGSDHLPWWDASGIPSGSDKG